MPRLLFSMPALRLSASEPLPVRPGAAHLFTVDVEEHFQVQAFESLVDRASWEHHPSRVVANTERLLDLLDRHQARGTFFTLGWVARREPGLLRRIADRGHEVASHSFWHRRVFTLSPDEFRHDLRDARAAIEDASGQPCLGFRAPTFSIIPGLEWALEVLVEEGFRYDSSLFPIRRPNYGYPDIPLVPFWIDTPAGRLLELPLATAAIGPFRLPAAGGGYLRQFPPALLHRGFRQWSGQGVSAMFYIHPWEVDPDQPRLPCGRLTTLRHYRNLDQTLPRMERLLAAFPFTSVRERFGDLLLAHPPAASGVAR